MSDPTRDVASRLSATKVALTEARVIPARPERVFDTAWPAMIQIWQPIGSPGSMRVDFVPRNSETGDTLEKVDTVEVEDLEALVARQPRVRSSLALFLQSLSDVLSEQAGAVPPPPPPPRELEPGVLDPVDPEDGKGGR